MNSGKKKPCDPLPSLHFYWNVSMKYSSGVSWVPDLVPWLSDFSCLIVCLVSIYIPCRFLMLKVILEHEAYPLYFIFLLFSYLYPRDKWDKIWLCEAQEKPLSFQYFYRTQWNIYLSLWYMLRQGFFNYRGKWKIWFCINNLILYKNRMYLLSLVYGCRIPNSVPAKM